MRNYHGMRKPLYKSPLDAVGTRAEVAARLNVDKSQLTRWAQRGIPAARVVDVERITGIPREQLRPDLYTREASQ